MLQLQYCNISNSRHTIKTICIEICEDGYIKPFSILGFQGKRDWEQVDSVPTGLSYQTTLPPQIWTFYVSGTILYFYPTPLEPGIHKNFTGGVKILIKFHLLHRIYKFPNHDKWTQQKDSCNNVWDSCPSCDDACLALIRTGLTPKVLKDQNDSKDCFGWHLRDEEKFCMFSLELWTMQNLSPRDFHTMNISLLGNLEQSWFLFFLQHSRVRIFPSASTCAK